MKEAVCTINYNKYSKVINYGYILADYLMKISKQTQPTVSGPIMCANYIPGITISYTALPKLSAEELEILRRRIRPIWLPSSWAPTRTKVHESQVLHPRA